MKKNLWCGSPEQFRLVISGNSACIPFISPWDKELWFDDRGRENALFICPVTWFALNKCWCYTFNRICFKISLDILRELHRMFEKTTVAGISNVQELCTLGICYWLRHFLPWLLSTWAILREFLSLLVFETLSTQPFASISGHPNMCVGGGRKEEKKVLTTCWKRRGVSSSFLSLGGSPKLNFGLVVLGGILYLPVSYGLPPEWHLSFLSRKDV